MEMEQVNNIRRLNIDEILPYIGEFGRFQKILDGIVFLIMIPITLHPVIMYFATLVPSWKCVNNGSICMFNGTFPDDDIRRCNMPRNEWYYIEKKEFSLVTQFDLHCKEKWLLYLITSMFFVGWGIGAIIIGWMADRYGRKTFIFPSVAIIFVVGFITPFMPDIYFVIVCRFIIGFFYPGVTIQPFVLLSELVGNKKRPLATIIPCMCFPISWMLLALKAYLLKNWKIMSFVCTAPYVFLLAFYSFVPESVRWLQLNGRHEDAMQILKKIAHWNKKELPPNIVLSSPSVTTSHKSNLIDLFRTRKIALHSWIQVYIWMFIGLSFYGLQLASSDLEGSAYRDFILLCIADFPSAFFSIVMCNRYGRKKATLIPLLIAGAFCLGIPFIPEEGKLKIARVTLGIIGKLFASTTFNSLYVWSAEMFPTDVRAEAMGMLQVSSRIGSASSPWVVQGLKPFGMWIPFVVMGITSLIGSVIGMWLPETKNMILKESIKQNENVIVNSNESSDKELNLVIKET